MSRMLLLESSPIFSGIAQNIGKKGCRKQEISQMCPIYGIFVEDLSLTVGIWAKSDYFWRPFSIHHRVSFWAINLFYVYPDFGILLVQCCVNGFILFSKLYFGWVLGFVLWRCGSLNLKMQRNTPSWSFLPAWSNQGPGWICLQWLGRKWLYIGCNAASESSFRAKTFPHQMINGTNHLVQLRLTLLWPDLGGALALVLNVDGALLSLVELLFWMGYTLDGIWCEHSLLPFRWFSCCSVECAKWAIFPCPMNWEFTVLELLMFLWIRYMVVELGFSVIWVMAESFGLNATQSVLDLGTSCISRAIVSC